MSLKKTYHKVKQFFSRKDYDNNYDRLHKADEPAIEWSNIDKEYSMSVSKYILDGPTVEWEHRIGYYVNGVKYSRSNFYKMLYFIHLNRILDGTKQ